MNGQFARKVTQQVEKLQKFSLGDIEAEVKLPANAWIGEKSLFYIQKPTVFEYKKVDSPIFRIDTKVSFRHPPVFSAHNDVELWRGCRTIPSNTSGGCDFCWYR